MRRMEWKWIILITVIILLVAAVAFLFIFVIKPPGSLTHPWLIPKAYTGDAGQTKTLTFAEILNAKQTGRILSATIQRKALHSYMFMTLPPKPGGLESWTLYPAALYAP